MCVKTNKTKKKVTEIMSCMSDFFSSFVTSVMANLAAGSSAWEVHHWHLIKEILWKISFLQHHLKKFNCKRLS